MWLPGKNILIVRNRVGAKLLVQFGGYLQAQTLRYKMRQNVATDLLI